MNYTVRFNSVQALNDLFDDRIDPDWASSHAQSDMEFHCPNISDKRFLGALFISTVVSLSVQFLINYLFIVLLLTAKMLTV